METDDQDVQAEGAEAVDHELAVAAAVDSLIECLKAAGVLADSLLTDVNCVLIPVTVEWQETSLPYDAVISTRIGRVCGNFLSVFNHKPVPGTLIHPVSSGECNAIS